MQRRVARGSRARARTRCSPLTQRSPCEFRARTTKYGDLDVHADIAGLKSYDELRRDAQQKRIAGPTVSVASIDHLIAMKRAANRAKDRVMLENYIVIADEQRRAAQEE